MPSDGDSGFDPYHKWLGIPAAEQPPDHYRLLGLSRFESDPDVIDAAASRQMGYLRLCSTGPRSQLSQRILNEVATARLCLLDPAKKAAYDADLKRHLKLPPSRLSGLVLALWLSFLGGGALILSLWIAVVLSRPGATGQKGPEPSSNSPPLSAIAPRPDAPVPSRAAETTGPSPKDAEPKSDAEPTDEPNPAVEAVAPSPSEIEPKSEPERRHPQRRRSNSKSNR